MTEVVPISVEQLDADPKTIRAAIPDMAAVLADCVAGGASVGFMDGFGIAEAALYWRGVFEAVARGFVPATRTSLSWALKRAYSIGNSDMRVFLKYGPSFAARLRELVKVAGALVLSPLLFVATGFGFDALRRLFRAAGKATALFGRHYNEYAVTHGD